MLLERFLDKSPIRDGSTRKIIVRTISGHYSTQMWNKPISIKSCKLEKDIFEVSAPPIPYVYTYEEMRLCHIIYCG